MSSYYDAFGGTDGPPDPFEDWEPRVSTHELVSTFVTGGKPKRQMDEYRGEAISDTEQDGDDWAGTQDDTDLDWSDLNDEAPNINIVTGEVEE